MWRTQTVCPLETVAPLVTNVVVHPMEYAPPVTLIGAGTLMPLTVMVFDVCTEPRATPVTGVNAKAAGL